MVLAHAYRLKEIANIFKPLTESRNENCSAETTNMAIKAVHVHTTGGTKKHLGSSEAGLSHKTTPPQVRNEKF